MQYKQYVLDSPLWNVKNVVWFFLPEALAESRRECGPWAIRHRRLAVRLLESRCSTLVRYQTVRLGHIIAVIQVMTGFQIGEECQFCISRWIVKQERTLT